MRCSPWFVVATCSRLSGLTFWSELVCRLDLMSLSGATEVTTEA